MSSRTITEELLASPKVEYCPNQKEPDQEHQRSPTTIIKDIANSYRFMADSNEKRGKVIEDDDLSCSLISEPFELNKSLMYSTMDPKSFLQKPQTTGECYSTIFTVSSSSSSSSFSLSSENAYIKSEEELSSNHSLLSPVVAFCNKCLENTKTEVIENLYPGSFWERLFCSFCTSSSNLREFSHICSVCEEIIFNIKLKVDV
jgi:hypothetical protein